MCAFLAEALASVLRRPHELHDLTQEALEGAAAGGGQAFSLLAACALRQAVRVLPSPKTGSAERGAVASYVSAVLQQLLQQQQGTGPLAAVVLGVLRLEAARQAAAAGGASPSPAGGAAQLTLPAEGGAIQALAAVAGRFQQDGAQQPPAKKRRKGRDAGSAPEPAAPEPVAVVIQGGEAPVPDPEAPRTLCSLITGLMQQVQGQAATLAAVEAVIAESGGQRSSAAARQCMFWLQHAGEPQVRKAGMKGCIWIDLSDVREMFPSPTSAGGPPV